MEEPARTERILARPFAWHREKPADQLLQRAGSVLFRVNGGSCLGVSFRLIVIGFNLLVGILAGLKPLIAAGSVASLAQCAAIFSMQIGLAILCFAIAPDADRFFSALAAAQFFAEGLSNLLLFLAGFVSGEAKLQLQASAFNLGLLAVFVPLIQMFEQRILSPTVKTVQAKGCNPRALAGAFIVLVASLPAAILKLVSMCGGGGGGGDNVNAGGAFATCCGKLGVLFGRSAASGDFAKAKATKVKSMAPQPGDPGTPGGLQKS